MSCDTSKYQCGSILPSSCIPYTGIDLTFLIDPTLLSCDANINDVFKLMDTALAKLISGDDLTGLNQRCLIFDPATITPAGLHQVEIDKICGLDASLNALTTQVNDLDISQMPVAIDLSCLSPAVSSCLTPPNTYPLIAVLNALVSEVCALKTAVGI